MHVVGPAHWCRDQEALVAWITEHQFKDDASLLNITRADGAQNDCRSTFFTLIPALKDLVPALTSEHLLMTTWTLLCRALVSICGLVKTIAIQRTTENCEFIKSDQGDILVHQLVFRRGRLRPAPPKDKELHFTQLYKRTQLKLDSTNDTNTLAV